MKKEDLEKLGLTVETLEKAGLKPEVLSEIIILHGKDIEKFKTTISTLQPQVDELTTQLKSANTTIGELKKVDPEKLQAAITDWETKFATAQGEWATKEQAIKFDHALETALKETFKARDPKEVALHLKRDGIKLNDDGTLLGLEEQVKPLIENKSYLFSAEDPNADPTLIVKGGQLATNSTSFDTALLKGAGLAPDTKLE